MIDPISVTAIIISVIAAVGTLLSRLKLKHILCCGCIESDCVNNQNENIIENNNNENHKIKFSDV